MTQLAFTGLCVGLARETATGKGVFVSFSSVSKRSVATLVGVMGTLTPVRRSLAGGIGSGIPV